MKKLVIAFTVVTAMIFATNASAQFFSYGAKAGVNLADLTSLDGDHTMKVGYHVGLLGRVGLTEMIAIQPEILFSTKGTKADGNDDGKLSLNYIDVPIKFVFNVVDALEVQAGPYISYLVSKPELSVKDVDLKLNKDAFNSLDYGLTAGLAYNFSNLFVSASYNYGFGKLSSEDKIKDNLKDLDAAGATVAGALKDAKNSVIRVSVGMRF